MSHTMEDKLLNLVKVFSLVVSKVLSLKEAAKLLNYSYWHLTRLYKKYLREGPGNLFVKKRKQKRRKLKDEDVELLKNYYISLGKPQISLLHYFLYIDHPNFPKISHEWMRKILIREGVYCPEERRKVFRKRFEAPSPGVLVQGDSSYEKWIPGDENYYSLIAFIDDCSRVCLGARLVERDTIEEHFILLKEIVKRYGKFVSLYYDNDEKYSYIRYGNSRFFEYKKDKAELQVVRALSEIGITVINSRPFDPHGKGKIERFIGRLQLQLPVWFRRYKVKSLKEGNAVLALYVEYYNSLQIHREIGSSPEAKFLSLKESSKFTGVGEGVDLDKIFSYRYERKVEKDNTIRFNGDVYQLERVSSLYSFNGKRAEVRYFPGRALSIYVDGKKVRWKKLPANRNNAKLEEKQWESCDFIVVYLVAILSCNDTPKTFTNFFSFIKFQFL